VAVSKQRLWVCEKGGAGAGQAEDLGQSCRGAGSRGLKAEGCDGEGKQGVGLGVGWREGVEGKPWWGVDGQGAVVCSKHSPVK
jgi:hypothetical protein